ncbi:MAG TPA: PRC-barrel domain-containing protein [Thermodesulfobacteriota bacterium]|nr:PRC-barrel domain-containing protein [Thermodesulfobacteriota bacterium]
MKKLWALVMATILISFGSITHAIDHKANPRNQEEALVVKNWKGEYIGSVRHVLLDSSTRNVAFIVLSLEKEKKEIVIPLESFSSYDQENGILILNVSKGILIAAPGFHLSDLKDPMFAERVYRFFGEAPLWTDRAKEGEKRM